MSGSTSSSQMTPYLPLADLLSTSVFVVPLVISAFNSVPSNGEVSIKNIWWLRALLQRAESIYHIQYRSDIGASVKILKCLASLSCLQSCEVFPCWTLQIQHRLWARTFLSDFSTGSCTGACAIRKRNSKSAHQDPCQEQEAEGSSQMRSKYSESQPYLRWLRHWSAWHFL